MNIVVCVKQVPDIEGTITVEKGKNFIQEGGLNYVTNPLDLVAVEEAVRIKEGDGQSRVTLISLGTPSSEKALRQGLSLGSDDAFLLSDPAFNNSDSYAIALVLAKAISLIPYDLILCGQRADDSQAGQVGAYIARMLGISLVRGVVKIDINPESKKLLVQRKLEKGDREVVECSPPVLLTVEAGLNKPRYPAVRAIMKAKGQKIEEFDSRYLKLPPERIGMAGSKTKISQLTPPKPKMKGLLVPDSKLSSVEKLRLIMEGGITQKKGDFLEGDPNEVASQLVQFFKQQKIISS